MHDPDDLVVIVAARKAWPFYQEAAGYFCQIGRSFRGAEWMGFYADRTIYPAVARVRRTYEQVDVNEGSVARYSLSPDPRDRQLSRMVRVARDQFWGSDTVQALLLTEQHSVETVQLNGGAGLHHAGSSAWTMGQRYTTLGALMHARSTEDLVADVH